MYLYCILFPSDIFFCEYWEVVVNNSINVGATSEQCGEGADVATKHCKDRKIYNVYRIIPVHCMFFQRVSNLFFCSRGKQIMDCIAIPRNIISTFNITLKNLIQKYNYNSLVLQTLYKKKSLMKLITNPRYRLQKVQNDSVRRPRHTRISAAVHVLDLTKPLWAALRPTRSLWISILFVKWTETSGMRLDTRVLTAADIFNYAQVSVQTKVCDNFCRLHIVFALYLLMQLQSTDWIWRVTPH